MEDENRGTDDSSKRYSNLEALVSMLQSFVKGARSGHLGYNNANRIDLTSAVERVKMQLQALPENVTEVIDRIVSIEQDIQRITH